MRVDCIFDCDLYVVALQFSCVAKNPNWTADLHFVMAIYIHLELNLGGFWACLWLIGMEVLALITLVHFS